MPLERLANAKNQLGLLSSRNSRSMCILTPLIPSNKALILISLWWSNFPLFSSLFPILGLTLKGLIGHHTKSFVAIQHPWKLVHNCVGVFSRGPPNFSSIQRCNPEISQALAQGSFLNLLPKFPLVSAFIWIIAFKLQKKIIPLIFVLLPNLFKPSIDDQPHTLDLVWVHLGSLWSHNFVTHIPQRSHRSHFSFKILRFRIHLVKIYSPTLGLSIPIALLRESITLLSKQASQLFEPLLWKGLGNHSISIHWSILPSDSLYTRSPPISECP